MYAGVQEDEFENPGAVAVIRVNGTNILQRAAAVLSVSYVDIAKTLDTPHSCHEQG